MSAKNGYVSITRQRSVSNILRGFAVLVDDTVIDRIKSGESKKYALPAGPHTLRVSLDFFKSEPLPIRLEPGQTVRLECGDGGPKTLGESFSVKGMGQSLKAWAAPSQFLYLRLLGVSAATIEPQHNKRASDRVSHSPPQRSRAAGQTIFLSYRREDSRAITGRISDRLTQHFGERSIFRDVDSIPIGVDFRERIRETIEQTDILISIIGPRWLDIRDENEQRRLDLDNDFVRLEIEEALAKDIPVVPVLVDAAEMPQADQLPDVLAPLAYRNALFIPREPYFHAGVDRLIEEIEGVGRGADKNPSVSQFCTGCGKPLSGQKFCTGCGQPAQT